MKLILNIVIILSCCSFPLFADEASNLEKLETLYQSLLDSVLSRYSASDTSILIRSIGTVQRVNWLIEKEIDSALRKHGVLNVLDSTAVESIKGARIEYQSLVCDISYIKRDKKNVRRVIVIQLFLKYVDSNSSVLFVDSFKRTEADTVSPKKLDQLENINLPFTQGKRSESMISRLAEPAAASLLTGMVILLFYFYRSH